MHEWALACSLIREAEAEARRRAASRVVGVTVRAGRLLGLVPELLERAYEVARTGTLLEGAALATEVEPIRARCPACGNEAELADRLGVCPACGCTGLAVIGGDGIYLTRLELEFDDDR